MRCGDSMIARADEAHDMTERLINDVNHLRF